VPTKTNEDLEMTNSRHHYQLDYSIF